MAETRNALGNVAMEAGDFIVEKFGEGAEVGAVLLVADVIHKPADADNDAPARNHVTYYCNDPRMWVQEALICEAGEVCAAERQHQQDAAEDAAIAGADDEDDEEDEE